MIRILSLQNSCADKSTAFIEVQYNPENHVVGFLIHDDEDHENHLVAVSEADARQLATDLLEGTQ